MKKKRKKSIKRSYMACLLHLRNFFPYKSYENSPTILMSCAKKNCAPCTYLTTNEIIHRGNCITVTVLAIIRN